ncbi:MAG: hypothetical protein FWE87_06445, partial [Coriobacteriia bacterium]|nr:hypothetical protein [Coriobacteriia bacterium]
MKECVILTTCSTISKRSSKVALFVGLSVLMILVSVLPATAGAATVSLVSHANGNPSYSGNEQSVFSNIDVSGTKIVFYSNATNLTADNPNGSAQVYLYDTVTKMTKLISKAATGAPGGGNNDSVWPNIDPTGRYVVFVSAASNLTNPNAPSNYAQIYRYDTLNDEMKLISHAVGAPNTPGNEHSGYSGVGEAPSIDASGKRIAFISKATNLTASGPGSSAQQIYLYDADLATPISIITQNGNQDASTVRISTDGSSLVFRSRATNYPASPSNASSENHQVYWFGIDTGVMRLVSHKLGSTLGLVGGIASVQPYPDLSADGSKVVFTTYDTEVIGGTGVGEFTQVYLYDMNDPSSVQLITHAWDDENVLANQNSRCPRISKDGRFVSFQSNSTNLVGYNHGSSQSQVYRYNVADGYAELVSHVPSDVTQASTFMVTEPRLSGDGAVVAFQAQGNDLVDATFPSMMWNVFAAALHTPDPPVTYTLSFDKNTTDEVIGMPSSISAAV